MGRNYLSIIKLVWFLFATVGPYNRSMRCMSSYVIILITTIESDFINEIDFDISSCGIDIFDRVLICFMTDVTISRNINDA